MVFENHLQWPDQLPIITSDFPFLPEIKKIYRAGYANTSTTTIFRPCSNKLPTNYRDTNTTNYTTNYNKLQGHHT